MNSSITTHKSLFDAEPSSHRTASDIQASFANRPLFMSFLAYNMHLCSHHSMGLTLMAISLNNLEWIHENYGPAAGDRILADAARRILECGRRNDSFARLSDDEFCMLLPGIIGTGTVGLTARQVLTAMETFMLPFGTRLDVTCSIGIAAYPYDGITADDLLHNARATMNQVRQTRRHGFAFYQRASSN